MLQQSGSVWVFISIHALREEGDQMGHILAALMPTFLSTPSARRATVEQKSTIIP